jgi:hypothetical protein
MQCPHHGRKGHPPFRFQRRASERVPPDDLDALRRVEEERAQALARPRERDNVDELDEEGHNVQHTVGLEVLHGWLFLEILRPGRPFMGVRTEREFPRSKSPRSKSDRTSKLK